MKFGITMFATDRTILPTRLGPLVEEAGLDSIYLGEHSHTPVDRSSAYPTGGELPDDFYRFHDPVTALTAIAAVTTRIELGIGTLVMPSHDPIHLAKRLATLDHVSAGRLVVGVGAGWNLEEIANHGTDPALRFTAVRERVEAVRSIWTQEVAEYHGRTVEFSPMYQWPKPVQTPHPPIYLGGAGPTSEERVVAYADGWLVSGRHLDGDELGRRFTHLQDLAEQAGRDAIPVMIQQGTPTPEALERYVEIGLRACTLRVHPGDEREIADQLEKIARLVEPHRHDAG
jgi:probable F420-dependent oxidoreductase